MERRATKKVQIGSVSVGGGAPISVQTMLPGSFRDPSCSAERLFALKGAGCDIIRVAFPEGEDGFVFGEFVKASPMPVVADIHFGYRAAISALKAGAAAVRINPGNMGIDGCSETVLAAKDRGAAIRIGINEGSFRKGTGAADEIEEYVNLFEKKNFTSIVLSVKSHDPKRSVDYNRELSRRFGYPLHIGVTEAGSAVASAVSNTLAISELLGEGIGDTVRVSMSSSMEDEVLCASEILRNLGLREGGIRITACPTCGRKSLDTAAFLRENEGKIRARYGSSPVPLSLAVMGCAVNGPGEAGMADVALSGVGEKIFLFKGGKRIAETDPERALEGIFSLLDEVLKEKQ